MNKNVRSPQSGRPYRYLSRLAKAVVLPAFALFLLAGGAMASDEEKAAKDTVKLETVKVTANKMEEDPMDVPQSITVIGEVEIEEKGMKSIRDVIDSVPSMSYSKGSHGTSINFRGLNASKFTSNNPVAMYVDGVGYSGSNGFDTSLVNVERVEVLRGPQATLYGKDSMGAVINVITKDPTNTWQGKLGTEYGSWQYGNIYGSANGPIIEDKLFLGFSAQYQRDQGWITNDYPGMDDDANRERDMRLNGYLLLTPTEDLRVRFSAHHGQNKEFWQDEYAMVHGSNLDSFDAADAKHVNYEVPTWTKINDDSQSLKVEYSFKSCKLDSITTHKTQELDGQYDADFVYNPAAPGLKMFDENEEELWGQEFRLSSAQAEGFRWTCGAYADTQDKKEGPFGMQSDMGMGAMEFDAHSTQNAMTQAAFGQIMVPFWESFELTLGGRYQRIHKDIDMTVFAGPVGATTPFYTMKTNKTWTTFLPKAALSYSLNDNWTTYLSYSHGYMAGGFNSFAMGGTVEDNTFKPEKSVNYEWGVKANYDKIRLSAALFYMDIKDIHIYKSVGPMYVTDNAKKAHSQGFELEAAYLPTDTLELSGSFSLIEAKYDDYDAGTKRFDGENIEQTPSHSICLSAVYRDPSGFYARADGRHLGSRSFYDDANQDFTKADPYTVFDGRIGYRFSDFDIYGYVKNLTNEGYATAFMSNSVTSNAGVSEPRKFGVGVLYNF